MLLLCVGRDTSYCIIMCCHIAMRVDKKMREWYFVISCAFFFIPHYVYLTNFFLLRLIILYGICWRAEAKIAAAKCFKSVLCMLVWFIFDMYAIDTLHALKIGRPRCSFTYFVQRVRNIT